LQMVKSGSIQVLDALGSQQVTVRDHTGQNPAPANAVNDLFQFAVQQRLAATDRDDGSAYLQ